MENKFYMKNDTKTIRLLPNYFKWIGVGMMILVGLLLIAVKLFKIELPQNQKEILMVSTLRFFLLGLFVIALARDKIEDELTLLLRLKAMGFIFTLVIVTVIIQPIIDLIWKNPLENLTPPHLVLRMLIAYHIFFFFLKKFR
ncbi:MAG TPA: hypothetical protein VKC90_13705 [Chitinophagaceae bacterium]|nr:hypothetical protein [Chitinophagaceae bacterium]